jgi:uncharacterized protein with FMN-binding domain
MTLDKNKFALITIISVIGLGAFIFVYITLTNSKQTDDSVNNTPEVVANNTTPTITPTSTTTPITSTTPAESSTNKYKDGTYTDSQAYTVDIGMTESIKVVFTIEGDKVTKIEDTYSKKEAKTKQYQNAFESTIESKVIGKKLDDINLSRIAGASLTTTAFMKAINAVKAAAI